MISEIQRLAYKYCTELRNTYGSSLTDLTWQQELAERSPEQHQIVCDVVVGCQGLLYRVANKLLNEQVKIISEASKPITLAGKGLEASELVGIANKHLIERFSKYNPKYAVTTFVGFYTRIRMYREGLNLTGIVTLPRAIATKTLGHGFDRIARALEGRRFKEGGVTTHEMAALIAANQWGYVDLFGRLNDEDNRTFEEVLTEDPESVARIVIPSEWAQMLRDMKDSIAHLTPKQQFVLRQRYWEGKGWHEIGAEMDLDSYRVRQIERKAVSELRGGFYTPEESVLFEHTL